MTVLAFVRRLFGRCGFFRRETPAYHRTGSSVGPLVSTADIWWEDKFHTEHQRKTERLAAIARERGALKDKLAKAVRDKKSRQPIYKALRALSSEELRIESGK